MENLLLKFCCKVMGAVLTSLSTEIHFALVQFLTKSKVWEATNAVKCTLQKKKNSLINLKTTCWISRQISWSSNLKSIFNFKDTTLWKKVFNTIPTTVRAWVQIINSRTNQVAIQTRLQVQIKLHCSISKTIKFKKTRCDRLRNNDFSR